MEHSEATEARDYARQDLTDAVQVALERDGHLLSAGEHHVARTFLSLSDPAASLYARLHSRRPTLFRRDQLSYAEVPDTEAAARELIDAGLADDERVLPAALLLSLRTAAELKLLCKDAGRKRTGRRDALLERLTDPPLPRAAVHLPALHVRHQKLFRRLCRLYLHDHSGDLSILVVTRIGHIRFPEYTPTGGAGLFPDRRALLEYEEMLRLRWSLTSEEAIAWLPRALELVSSRPRPPDHRHRFSARRLAADLALGAARELERAEEHAAAEAAYATLLDAGIRGAGEASRRRAMCLAALGRHDEAAAACDAARASATPAEQLALERTGRRLARKAGARWTPARPLASAPVREIDLTGAALPGHRPGYATDDGATTIERALCQSIRAAGRQVFFGESAPWSTLFALLCHEAIFAPVPGMLPTARMHRPLDLGSPGFAERRAAWLEPLLARIALGEARQMLEAALPELADAQLSGARWDRFRPAQLLALADAIDGPSLSGILRCFAEDYRAANRGLPDLCVLPGPAVRLEGALPGTLPETLLLAEVKGPTDSLRDGQRVWLDRLLGLGVPTELWKVRRRKAGRVRRGGS